MLKKNKSKIRNLCFSVKIKKITSLKSKFLERNLQKFLGIIKSRFLSLLLNKLFVICLSQEEGYTDKYVKKFITPSKIEIFVK